MSASASADSFFVYIVRCPDGTFYAGHTANVEARVRAHKDGRGVVPIRLESLPIARESSAAGVEASVRQAQRGEIVYPQFFRQTVAAGCVGYFVQITGKRVQYFGREGDIHTEWFPGAAAKQPHARTA